MKFSLGLYLIFMFSAFGFIAPRETPSNGITCTRCTSKSMCSLCQKEAKHKIACLVKARIQWKSDRENAQYRNELWLRVSEAAALTYRHPVYKSEEVVSELGKTFRAPVDEQLRIYILDLLDDRQNERACLEEIIKCLKRDDLTEDMTVRLMAAMAYFENEKSLDFLKMFFDYSSHEISYFSIDCISYIDGKDAVRALIDLMGVCVQRGSGRTAGLKGWWRPLCYIRKILENKTKHLTQVRDFGKPIEVANRIHRDWHKWWLTHGCRYESAKRSLEERKAWKEKINHGLLKK